MRTCSPFPRKRRPLEEGVTKHFLTSIREIMMSLKEERRLIVECICGKQFTMNLNRWWRGTQESCGCKFNAKTNLQHGMSGTKIHRRWRSMIQRCRDPNNNRWKYYGGKGIKVCERWLKFENFLADMGEAPSGMTIDRIDSAGNYEPSNCRWSSYTEQNRHRSNTIFITAFGQTKPRGEWCQEFNIDSCTLRDRIKAGWPAELALNLAPLKQWSRRA